MSGRGVGAEGMVTNFATDHHPGITIKRSQIVFSILRSAQSSLYPLHPIEKIPETDTVFRLKLTKFPPPFGGGYHTQAKTGKVYSARSCSCTGSKMGRK